MLSICWVLLCSLSWESCRDPWLTSPTGDQRKPLSYCFLREETETQSDLVFCLLGRGLEGRPGSQLRMRSWRAWSFLLRLLASASHLPPPPKCVPPHLPLKPKPRPELNSWAACVSSVCLWEARASSEVTRQAHTLQSQFRELLWATNKLDGVAWQLAGCFFNIEGKETDPGYSWLQSTLASGQWKRASSTLAGMGAAPGRWWVGD